MLWKLFGSKNAVENALNQSVGYDISPAEVFVQTPANLDVPSSKPRAADKKVSDRDDLEYVAPWEEKKG